MAAMDTQITDASPNMSGKFPSGAAGDGRENSDAGVVGWRVTESLLEGSIIIPVMGMTGSGKSYLIKRFGAQAEYARRDGLRVPEIGKSLASGWFPHCLGLLSVLEWNC